MILQKAEIRKPEAEQEEGAKWWGVGSSEGGQRRLGSLCQA
jgi:hypothetical protein